MKRHFDDELGKLKEKLLKMGLLVEKAVADATSAVFDRDSEKANLVIKGDQEINVYEIEIDEFAHELIALYKPAAKDLRLITMALKINSDLERMGDQAVNIAQGALLVNQATPLKPYEDLPIMTERTRAMVRDALNAFMDKDLEKAQAILEADDEVDECNRRVSDDVQTLLETKPDQIRTGVTLIMMAHNLERIADLATNIAEDVIYLKKGIDVRHHIRERRKA